MANKVQINGYFYNAIKTGDVYDRLYNDEDFCSYLNKLVGNGVFPTPSNQLAVTANDDMTISIAPGDAWMEGHKVSNDAIQTLDISPAHAVFDRIDRVVVYTDSSTERAAGIKVITGTANSTTPVAPDLERTDEVYEMALADIYVKKNAEAITAADLTDQRPNSEVCGWVAGLIQQIDVTSLYEQYLAGYEFIKTSMQDWMDDMKTEFDSWFYNMNSNLTVGAYIRTFKKTVEGGESASNIIPLDMTGYEYDVNDVIFVNFNGFMLTKDVDYTLTINGGVASITLNGDMTAGNVCDITIMKSSMAQTAGGYLTRVRGEKFLHVDDAIPGEVNTFTVNNLGQENEIVYTNKNIIDGSQIVDTIINGISFTKNADGSITIDGEAIDDVDTYIEVELDRNLLQYANHYAHLIMVDEDGSENVGTGEIVLVVDYKNGNTPGSETITRLCNWTGTSENTYKFTPPSVVGTAEENYNIQTITVKIGFDGTNFGGTEIDSKTVYPMIIFADNEYFTYNEMKAMEYEEGTRDTFLYDGVTKPNLKGVSNTVYSTDNEVSDLLMVYLLDATSIVNGDDALYPQNS